MASPTPRNALIRVGDAITRPYKWASFLGAGAGEGVTRP